VPTVVEIYPRALTGPVNKGRWADRHAFLLDRFPQQPTDLIERAAGSEDAFDAAVSALVMGAHAAKLETLPSLSDDLYRIEGKICAPLEPDHCCRYARVARVGDWALVTGYAWPADVDLVRLARRRASPTLRQRLAMFSRDDGARLLDIVTDAVADLFGGVMV
jgi:hypothetical protein